MDENYRRALDRIALADGSKRELIRSLAARSPGGVQPRRALRASAVLVLAAVGVFCPLPAGVLGTVLSFLLSPVVLVVAAGVAGLCIRAARGGLK